MNSSLMDEAVAVDSGGIRQPEGGKPAGENWINSDSIGDRQQSSPKNL